ncbi:MAG: dynamin family protein [Akkermansiaceae bacterium]|nr:dynamin family protein [Akkermansiaceae bacterium]
MPYENNEIDKTMITLTKSTPEFISQNKQSNSILSERLHNSFEDLRELYTKTILMAAGRLASKSQIKRLKEKLDQLDLAALFVIVGEVKAGKSSFINGLLGAAICPVDAGPCTESIQELVHGPTRKHTELDSKWERVALPCDELKSITVVDTPGTNSIEQHHEKITEDYLHRCDVVVFVLSAMNPHTGSAWDFLGRIRSNYLHRVVFVLQQADLPTPDALKTNFEIVRKQARKFGISDPQIFPVSALKEATGDENSGYSPFRDYVKKAVETGEVWNIKFDGSCEILKSVLDEIANDLAQGKDKLMADLQFAESLQDVVDDRKHHINEMSDFVTGSLMGTYDRLTDELVRDFQAGLTIRTVFRRSIPFIKDVSLREWLKDLEKNFQQKASKQINFDTQRCSKQLHADINDMINEIDQKIKDHHSTQSNSFSDLMADGREKNQGIGDDLNKESLVECFERSLPDDIQLENNINGGGAMIAIGGAIALLTQIAIFDITGGILASLGATLIGLTLLVKRGAIIKDMERQIKSSRSVFEEKIANSIKHTFGNLFGKIDHDLNSWTQKSDNALGEIDVDIEDVTLLQSELSTLRDGS